MDKYNCQSQVNVSSPDQDMEHMNRCLEYRKLVDKQHKSLQEDNRCHYFVVPLESN